jgi:hypothetical protein
MLRGLFDRIVLVAAIAAAACVPGYIAQYRQYLAGRLEQVTQDLALFQQIADHYHHGSLQALIAHHFASPDPSFHAEGVAIQTMLEASERLRAGLQALNADMLHQLQYLALHGDPQIAHAVWNLYVPSFTLSGESALFGIAAGLIVWLAFLALWQLVTYTLRLLRPARTRVYHRS